MRIPRLKELMMKDRYVLPMPFMKLISVLFVYRNGQSQDMAVMNFPARAL